MGPVFHTVVRILRLATRCYVIQITSTCDDLSSGYLKSSRTGSRLNLRPPLYLYGLLRYFDRSRLTREAIAEKRSSQDRNGVTNYKIGQVGLGNSLVLDL